VNALVWGLDWRLTLAGRRSLAFWVLVPLALVVVIATAALPAAWGIAAYSTLFIGSGLLRAALPVFVDTRSGLTGRVLRGGVSPASYLLQRAAAAAATTLLCLLPAACVVALSMRAAVPEMLIAVGGLAVSLWITGLAGAIVGTVSESTTEVMVLGGVLLVVLLHMSGVFRTPGPGTLGALLENSSPFRAMHEALASMASGGAVSGGLAVVAWAALLPMGAGLAASNLLARPKRAGPNA
jgi:hypothetical protein